jgi:hypothetical protein
MRCASRPIFRVSFSGPPLEGRVLADALECADSRYEGTLSEPDEEVDHHRALVGADTKEEAIAFVREAMAPYGTVGDFLAAPVTDACGEVKRTPIRTRWSEVDWEEVQSKVALSDLERALIGTFLDAAEPTWIILSDPEVPDDVELVQDVLQDLERRGLVYSTWEPAFGPEDFGVLETWHGRPERMCHWWALTDEGWDLLGLIKSPGYR